MKIFCVVDFCNFDIFGIDDMAVAIGGGALLSTAASFFGASQSRDFQREMSSTAYQRAVGDMKSAGLNPMLAYQQGGAASGSGGQPQVPDLGSSMASAVQSRRVMSESRLLDAQTKKVEAETPGVGAESERLVYELRKLVPWKAASAELNAKLQETQLFMNQLERSFASLNTNRELVRRHFEAKYRELPADVRRKMAEALLTELEVPKAEAYAGYYKGVGKAEPYVAGAGKLLSGGDRAFSYFRRGR